MMCLSCWQVCVHIQDNLAIWDSVSWASQVALVVKNLPANTGDTREAVLIPGLGRFPGVGSGDPL